MIEKVGMTEAARRRIAGYSKGMRQRIKLALAIAHDPDRKSTRLNSSHTEIYTLSLHDALPIYDRESRNDRGCAASYSGLQQRHAAAHQAGAGNCPRPRSEEHTSELQSHRDLHSFPTRRSSDL